MLGLQNLQKRQLCRRKQHCRRYESLIDTQAGIYWKLKFNWSINLCRMGDWRRLLHTLHDCRRWIVKVERVQWARMPFKLQISVDSSWSINQRIISFAALKKNSCSFCELWSPNLYLIWKFNIVAWTIAGECLTRQNCH